MEETVFPGSIPDGGLFLTSARRVSGCNRIATNLLSSRVPKRAKAATGSFDLLPLWPWLNSSAKATESYV